MELEEIEMRLSDYKNKKKKLAELNGAIGKETVIVGLHLKQANNLTPVYFDSREFNFLNQLVIQDLLMEDVQEWKERLEAEIKYIEDLLQAKTHIEAKDRIGVGAPFPSRTLVEVATVKKISGQDNPVFMDTTTQKLYTVEEISAS